MTATPIIEESCQHHAPPVLLPRPSPRIYNGDTVAIPLFIVLAILDVRIQYSEDAFTFVRISTGRQLLRRKRSEKYANPWVAMHEAGWLTKANFEGPAKAYFKNHELPEQEDGEEA